MDISQDSGYVSNWENRLLEISGQDQLVLRLKRPLILRFHPRSVCEVLAPYDYGAAGMPLDLRIGCLVYKVKSLVVICFVETNRKASYFSLMLRNADVSLPQYLQKHPFYEPLRTGGN